MYGLKEKLKKKQILLFLIMTFAGTYLCWGTLLLSSKGVLSKDIYTNNMYYTFFNVLGGSMPSIMSIILTGFLYKKKGLKALLTRLTKWRYNLIYYIIAVFYVIASFYIFYLICKFFGSKGKVTFINTKPYYILGGFMFTLLSGGPLGEEIGWRGFLLPRLQKRLNPFFSSIVLGVIWSCWHLPLFFIVGTVQYGIPFLVFIMETTSSTIIITWIFNRTNGSLIFPILFHTCSNMIWCGILVGSINFLIANAYKFFTVQIVIMIFVVRDMFKNSKYGRVTVDNGDIVVIDGNK